MTIKNFMETTKFMTTDEIKSVLNSSKKSLFKCKDCQWKSKRCVNKCYVAQETLLLINGLTRDVDSLQKRNYEVEAESRNKSSSIKYLNELISYKNSEIFYAKQNNKIMTAVVENVLNLLKEPDITLGRISEELKSIIDIDDIKYMVVSHEEENKNDDTCDY